MPVHILAALQYSWARRRQSCADTSSELSFLRLSECDESSWDEEETSRLLFQHLREATAKYMANIPNGGKKSSVTSIAGINIF